MGCINSFSGLKQTREFQHIYRRGKSGHSRSMVLFYLSRKGEKKIGFTASKKVGNAVARNRGKRRMRALFAEYCDLLQDGVYIFVAKSPIVSTPYATLKQECKKVLMRTGGLCSDTKNIT